MFIRFDMWWCDIMRKRDTIQVYLILSDSIASKMYTTLWNSQVLAVRRCQKCHWLNTFNAVMKYAASYVKTHWSMWPCVRTRLHRVILPWPGTCWLRGCKESTSFPCRISYISSCMMSLLLFASAHQVSYKDSFLWSYALNIHALIFCVSI